MRHPKEMAEPEINSYLTHLAVSEKVKQPLKDHLETVRRIHEIDLAAGFGRVQMPYALERKHLYAAAEWGWQFVFPQEQRWVDGTTGQEGRHHSGLDGKPSKTSRVMAESLKTLR
jgi:hypothetical protein